jgi:hypothetical protein
MLHVDDDTNDELFRKAADDYFLKEAVPDWDSLYNKINATPPPAGNDDKKKRRYKWLFSFFYQPFKKMDAGIYNSFRGIFGPISGSGKAKKKIIPVACLSWSGTLAFGNSLKSIAVIETGDKKYFYYFNGP